MKFYDPMLIRKDPMLLKRVEEMAPDFWWIEGYFPDVFFGQPVCSNSYLIKDGRDLVLIDNGKSGIMQEKILGLVNLYAGQVDRFYITLTQAHLDHAGNNEVINEHKIGESHFILNEREIPVLEFTDDWLSDLQARGQYYDWHEDLSTILPVVVEIARLAPDLADQVIQSVLSIAYPPLESMKHKVEPLRMDDLQSFTFGTVTLQGWPLGRLVIIADCAHSPGHVSVYDPENKIMLCGDVTIEINPVLLYSSVNGLIRYNSLFRQMAEEGHIEMVGDGHRSKSNWGKVLAKFPEELRDKVAEGDFVVGRDNCVRFFERFEGLHRGQRQAVIETHQHLGTVSIPEIADALLGRTDKATNFMKAMHSALASFSYPWRQLCLNVALEQHCKKIDREGENPLFEPPDLVIDEPRVDVPWRGLVDQAGQET